MKKQKSKAKYTNIVTKVTPELRDKVRSAGEKEARTISQQVRKHLEDIYNGY